MKQFVLLMQGDDSHTASPTEMQARLESYMAWMKKMTAAGTLQGGQPLEPGGVLLEDKDTVLTDGPFLEPNEIIGGYLSIRASDIDEAIAVAKECPLLDHCRIMVRPVLEVPGA